MGQALGVSAKTEETVRGPVHSAICGIGRSRLLMYRKVFHRTKTSTSNRYRDTTRRYTLLVVSSNSTLIENEKAR